MQDTVHKAQKKASEEELWKPDSQNLWKILSTTKFARDIYYRKQSLSVATKHICTLDGTPRFTPLISVGNIAG